MRTDGLISGGVDSSRVGKPTISDKSRAVELSASDIPMVQLMCGDAIDYMSQA